jgi:pyrrolidone-carboxylate peptidase
MGARVLVTGFGPFLDVTENPSAVLAESCGAPHEVLEVSFRAAEEFVRGLEPSAFDVWLALGANTRGTALQTEAVGRNHVTGLADVRGESYGPGPIDPAGPWQLHATLWSGGWAERDGTVVSWDAGRYLCNFLLYTALRRFPGKRIGFLHVPPVAAVPMASQERSLARILAGLGA